MKALLLFLGGCLCTLSLFAQSSLPTSYDFTGMETQSNWPTGWTSDCYSGCAYTGSGNPAPARRFNADNQFVTVWVNDEMGPVSYDIAFNLSSGAFNGIFEVRESADNSTWTVLKTYDMSNVACGPGCFNGSVYHAETVQPSSSARYIQFFARDDAAGNVGLDNVSIAAKATANPKEIQITRDTTDIQTGSLVGIPGNVGVTNNTSFIISNIGATDSLEITSATFSGSGASLFSIVSPSLPFKIAAGRDSALVIGFAPTSAGLVDATLTILNDDASEGTFVINIIGAGDSLAVEPTIAPSLALVTNKTYEQRIRLTKGSSNGEGFVVVRSRGTGGAIPTPLDGVSYEKGDVIGDSKVIFGGRLVGADTVLDGGYVEANNTYVYYAYTYNGLVLFQNYLTSASSSVVLSVKTPATEVGNYYSGINPNNATFATDLANLLSTGATQRDYDDYYMFMVDGFYARDTTEGRKAFNDPYSGVLNIYTPPASFATTNSYSREHCFAHSWMPTHPSTSGPEYSDYHNLYPVDQNRVNSVRSNDPFGNVVSGASTWGNASRGNNSANNAVYEVQDSTKGDVARSLFYMIVRYWNGSSWDLPNPISSLSYGQDQATLMAWHFLDPPSNAEMARNEFVENIQGNRNPFIDHLSWPCYFDFETPAKLATPNTSADCEAAITASLKLQQDEVLDFVVFPNPVHGQDLKIAIDLQRGGELLLELVNLNGEIVERQEYYMHPGFYSSLPFDTGELAKGIYFLKGISEGKTGVKKLVIE